MYKYASGKRKYLGLVLQAAEWRREYEPVVVTAKFGAGAALGRVVVVFEAKPLVVDELLPVHGGLFMIHDS